MNPDKPPRFDNKNLEKLQLKMNNFCKNHQIFIPSPYIVPTFKRQEEPEVLPRELFKNEMSFFWFRLGIFWTTSETQREAVVTVLSSFFEDGTGKCYMSVRDIDLRCFAFYCLPILFLLCSGITVPKSKIRRSLRSGSSPSCFYSSNLNTEVKKNNTCTNFKLILFLNTYGTRVLDEDY